MKKNLLKFLFPFLLLTLFFFSPTTTNKVLAATCVSVANQVCTSTLFGSSTCSDIDPEFVTGSGTCAQNYTCCKFNTGPCGMRQSNGKYLIGGACGSAYKDTGRAGWLYTCDGAGGVTNMNDCGGYGCRVNSGKQDTCVPAPTQPLFPNQL